ncbi:hypothetical protein DYH09_30805, partial [bacterium CPR1]|nr:hypothetical protein [bacterium CPR1]
AEESVAAGEGSVAEAFGFEPVGAAEAFGFEPGPTEEGLGPQSTTRAGFDPAQEAPAELEAFGFEPGPARPGPSVTDPQDFEPIALALEGPEKPESEAQRLTATFELADSDAVVDRPAPEVASEAEGGAFELAEGVSELDSAELTNETVGAEALDATEPFELDEVEVPAPATEAEVEFAEGEAHEPEEAVRVEFPVSESEPEPEFEPAQESASPGDALEDEEGDAMIASEPRIDDRWGPLVGAVLKAGTAQELLLSLPRPQDTRESLEKMSQLARRLELAGRPQEAALVALRRIEIEDGPQARHELMRILQLWSQSLAEVDLIELVARQSGQHKPARTDIEPEKAPRSGPPVSPMPRGPIKPPVKPPSGRTEVQPELKAPVADEKAPLEGEKAPVEERKAPLEEEKPPVEEQKLPVEEAKAAVREVKPSVVGTRPAPSPPALAEDSQKADSSDLDDLREQLFEHPTDAALRARALELLGQDPSGLVRFYRELSARLPESAPHLLNVARAYVHSQQDQLAVLNFQKALKLEGTAEGYHELSQVYVRLGKNELASKTAEKARELEAGG